MFRNGKYKLLSLLFIIISLYFQAHSGVSVVLLTHREQSIDFCCFSHEFILSLFFLFFFFALSATTMLNENLSIQSHSIHLSQLSISPVAGSLGCF